MLMTTNDTLQAAQAQTQEIIAVSQFEQIIDAAGIMHEHGIGCLIVAAGRDDETMVGIIKEQTTALTDTATSNKSLATSVHRLADVIGNPPTHE